MARALLLLLVTAITACAPSAPDLLLLNGRVFTADPAAPWAEAVAVRGDRIVAVGTTEAVAALAGPATERRDLGGRTVLPGFNDAHVIDPGGDAAALRDRGRAAVAAGVTSMQWFVDRRTVRDAGRALVEADTPLRVRMLRMPRTGPDGATIDSRPHLPPQPTPRVDIRGMAFLIGPGDGSRLAQAVGWAYGTEDLLAVEPAADDVLVRYIEALERTGLPDVWTRKRPRVEQVSAAAVMLADRMQAQGLVVVQRPGSSAPLRSLLDHRVPLALGSGDGRNPYAVLAWATSADRGAEALTMADAVTAFTRQAAFAEHADRDKGHLSVGALADLSVASLDPFTTPPEALAGARSVLTLIGGRSVHDVP